MDERDVLLAIAVIPETDYLDTSEARGEAGDRFDLDADVVRPKTCAVVLSISFDQILESWYRCQGLNAGDFVHGSSVTRVGEDRSRGRKEQVFPGNRSRH